VQSGDARTIVLDARMGSAKLLSLPWGKLGGSVSVERRHETYNVTNDQVEICDGGAPDCTQSGNWTGTSTTITIDPGADAVTFNWTIQGNTMTWTGSINDVPATVVLVRQS